MKTKIISVTIAILSAACIVLVASLASQQHVRAQQSTQQPRTAEQAFKNIKVIKNMPAGQLQNAMAFMSASLGVDCTYCHTPPAMEKDDKPVKETARRMLTMVTEINKNLGQNVVTCATCHRGNPKPVVNPPLPSLGAPFSTNNVSVSQPPLPTVDEVLNRYMKALGGEQALDKVSSRSRKGSVAIHGLQGSFELYEAAPNKSLLIASMPAPLGGIQQGFEGTTGWVKNQSGLFDMSGDGLAQAKHESAFYNDVKLKEQFKVMTVAGRQRLDGREFTIVEGTGADGKKERFYFDDQTGMLARRYWETPTYFGAIANVNDYDDYRKVGSVRVPIIVRKVRSGNVFLMTVSDYKLNPKLDDAKFKKPVAVK